MSSAAHCKALQHMPGAKRMSFRVLHKACKCVCKVPRGHVSRLEACSRPAMGVGLKWEGLT